GQQPAHRRRLAAEHHALYHQRALLCRSLKKQKMDDMVLMLRGAMAAEGKVGLMMNVPKERLSSVLKVLPALQNPTVSGLSNPDWVAVNTIIDENTVRHIVPQLKQAGACGIVEYPLNKIID